MILFILVVQNNNLGSLTFSEVAVYNTRYVFIHARDYSQALQIVQIFKPDCFLIEENFPTISSLEFMYSLHAQPGMEQIPTIVLDARYIRAIQEQKTSSPDKTIPISPYVKILLTIIDKKLLFSGWVAQNSFSMD